MAIFDRENGKLVVRVVYDGPGNAGKTTNILEICRFFSTMRRGELVSPEEHAGRTLWFDWVQVDAGVVAGYGLRCQIVTVPGQLVLRRRRSALLRSADVVVLVCDSTPSGLARLRPAFGRVRQFIAEHVDRDVPLVIQANKQDLPDAVSPEEVGARLDADSSIPVVGARAREGIGVRETLVLAIRAAANRAQRLVLERGIDELAAVVDDADAVLARLRGLDDVSGDACVLMDDHGFAEDEPPAPSSEGAEPPTRVEVETSAEEPVAVEEGVAEVVASAPTEDPVAAVEEEVVASALTEEPLASSDEDMIEWDPRPSSPAPPWWPIPPTVSANIAPGNLWPAATGREVLRALEGASPTPRLDLVGRSGVDDGSGKPTTIVYDAAGWCLKTSTVRRFSDLDRARAALVALARTKVSLGPLSLRQTLLVIGTVAPDEHWLWTYAPWRKTLRSTMTEAFNAGDAEALATALVQFAHAVAESVSCAAKLGQGLDIHPSNFAVDEERVVYLDDEVSSAPPLLGAAHSILQRAEEYASFPESIAAYGDALVERLRERLSSQDIARLGLVDGLRAASPRSLAALALRKRLVAALDSSSVAQVDASADAAVSAPGGSLDPVATAAGGASHMGGAVKHVPLAAQPAGEAASEGDEPTLASSLTEALERAVTATSRSHPGTDADPAPPRAAGEGSSEPERPVDEAEKWPEPPMAAEHLPSGFIWPVVAGRELVRRLATRKPVRRANGPLATYDLGDYVISTTVERRFAEVDDGRAELLRLARAQIARGATANGAVLVLAPDAAGEAHWIWTFTPIGDEPCASP